MSVQTLSQKDTGHALGLAYLTDVATGPKSVAPFSFTNAAQLTWTPNAQGGVGSANTIASIANPFTAFTGGVSGLLQVNASLIAVANANGANSSTYSSFKVDLVDAAVPATIFGTTYLELVADPVALGQQNILNFSSLPMIVNSTTMQSVANLALVFTFVGVSTNVWTSVVSAPNQVSVSIASSVF